MKGLSAWRVEWFRLFRTRRALVLAALYLFLGASGPLIAKYAQQIFAHASNTSTVTITVASPTPEDGILGYTKSAMQLGLVACIVIAGLAVCLDSRPGLSIYYRTRTGVARILMPRLVVSVVASCLAYTLGMALAYYETIVLIGWPALGATAETWALNVVYTAFAVALTFLAAALSRGALGAVGIAIGLVLLLPIIGSLKAVARYLPSELTSLPTDIFHRVGHPSPLPAVLVTVAVGGVGVVAALQRVTHRELRS